MRGSFECAVSGCMSQPTLAIDVSYYLDRYRESWATHTYVICPAHEQEVIRTSKLYHPYIRCVDVTVSPGWLTQQQEDEERTSLSMLEQWALSGGQAPKVWRERKV